MSHSRPTGDSPRNPQGRGIKSNKGLAFGHLPPAAPPKTTPSKKGIQPLSTAPSWFPALSEASVLGSITTTQHDHAPPDRRFSRGRSKGGETKRKRLLYIRVELSPFFLSPRERTVIGRHGREQLSSYPAHFALRMRCGCRGVRINL